ncbi:MAG: hypothetical protein OXJ52_01480 [Oligoflexia bacterium]|nr:hypothetical protein [Oligoflexia bacterium]
MRFLFFIFYTSFSFGQTLILSPGEKAWIPLPFDQKVRLGDKSLLILQKENNQISLLARKAGQTLLITGAGQYEIFIFDKDNKTKALHLERILKKLWGLSWSLSKDNVFEIKGQLYRFSDWLEIMKECKKYNISYQFKAQMDEELKKISSYYFKTVLQQEIEAQGSNLPYVFVPTGYPPSRYKSLKAFGLIPKEEEFWFFKAPLVQIDLAVVETLSSSVFSTGGHLLKPLSHFSSLLSFLNFLKSSGKGKTLHHSSLNTQSGKEIQLKSGGQIPFNSYNLKTEQKSVNWKSHGLQVHLIPTVGKKDQIKLKIKAQLSEPLSFSSSDQAPPLKTQNLESEFVLDDKQILKIFQMYKKSKGSQYKGQLGFLESIPSFLLGGQNSYKMTQSVFIQIQILKEQTKSENLKEVL